MGRASRIRGRVQITTDGNRVYLDAVEDAFGVEADYAMLQKIYGAPSDEEIRRYSPARCIGYDLKVVSGDPDPKHVSTSYVERKNLTMRMGMRRFTRLTNGFSKKLANHAAMVAMHFVYYNFARIHKTRSIVATHKKKPYILTQMPVGRIVNLNAAMQHNEAFYESTCKDRDLPDSFQGAILCFHSIGLGTAGGSERLRHAPHPPGPGHAAECERDACPAAAMVGRSSLSHRDSQ